VLTRSVVPVNRHAVAPSSQRVSIAEPAILSARSDQQYAVLLLNEQQMTQLLQRPAMRHLNSRFSPAHDAFAAYTRLMRHARIAMVVLVVLIAGATAWAWAPMPALTVLPWGGDQPAPTVATGASFSLTVPSSRTSSGAADVVGRLIANGVPAFTQTMAKAGGYQVMVGPFVSLDEAERQQRQLARAGLGGARVFVDDSLRHVKKNDVVSEAPGNPSLVLVGVGERMSLAIELKSEPRQVNTRRAADGTFTVEIGPTDADVEEQEWSAPAGVDLVRGMKVEEIAVTPEASFLRATLTMPPTTAALARLEGRRVYIDLKPGTRGQGQQSAPRASAKRAATQVRPLTRSETAAPTAGANAASPAAATTTASVTPAARESMPPLVGRFERLVPFLQSAAATASPDVLRALASTLDELDASLRQVVPAPETADAHGALVSAVAPARRAIDVSFAGDRIAQAKQAAMLVEAARTVMPK
jgi:hypothetical protein